MHAQSHCWDIWPPAAVMHCQACGDVRVTSTRKCDAVGLLAPLAAGGTAIIPAGGKFSAGTHWRDAVEHKATYYTAVPTMHQVRRWPPLSKQFHCRMHCTLTLVQLCTVSIKGAVRNQGIETPPNQQSYFNSSQSAEANQCHHGLYS